MRKLSFRHIKVNQPLSWDVFDQAGGLLLRKGYVIESEKQVRGLVERGLFVTGNAIDDEETPTPPPPKPQAPTRFDPFWLWDDIHAKLVRVLRNIEAEDMVEDKLTSIALLVNVLTDKDADAALGAILLKDAKRYTFTHALHVAVMAAIISRRLGWDDDERRDLVCTALSMNVAMIDLQTELTVQQTPLTAEQRAAIDAHSAQGSELLARRGVRNVRWLKAVEQHHTRQDLDAGALTKPDALGIAELVRILDVFCAKISPRAYRLAIQPPAAARDIFVGERDRNNPFLGPLIKEVGIYMPGTFIKLESGEIALVVQRGQTANTPKALALSRDDGMPYGEGIRRDTARPEYAVRGVVPKDRVPQRLDLPRLWGYAA